ncbi:MAG: 4-alpha-glucanotransferase [Clostridia bacterium]|nr:4-alpha-glucanotransferase [Clostridia bacterium]
MNKRRRSGILMPISALPNKYGIGTLGECSKRFIDYLHQAGVSVWQTLPLLPTNYGDSPYQSCDSNALNYYFIDFDLLKKDGLLEEKDYAFEDWGDNPERVDYGKLFLNKAKVLKKAFDNFDKQISHHHLSLKV